MPVPTVIDDDRGPDDPLALLTAPPHDESPNDRLIRLRKEVEAKNVSDAIDEEINRSKALSKRKKMLKLLLLGQSESGKSTTLKNIQLLYSPRQFKDERISWRAVIYLNIARSVRIIVEAVHRTHYPDTATISTSSESQETLSIASFPLSHSTTSLLTDTHWQLLSRLGGIHRIEDRLIERLAAKGETEATSRRPTQQHELAVLASSRWKSLTAAISGEETESVRELAWETERQEEEEIARELRDVREDIEVFLNDPVVQSLEAVIKLRLEDLPGLYFLDCLERTTAPGYEPTDDDVLRARLKTLGVTEHNFVMNIRTHFNTPEWTVFDVGGTRCQRNVWIPYFQDIHTIIFLAPLSAFDQTLVEDRTVNRLEDSLILWKTVCSNKLLQKSQLILFMNKCDLLQKKLDAGVHFSSYVKTYPATHPNDFRAAGSYMRRKFEHVQRQYSPIPRHFHCHMTSLMDTRETSAIILSVTDLILRQSLHTAALV